MQKVIIEPIQITFCTIRRTRHEYGKCLGHLWSICIKIIHTITVFSPYLWASFHPLYPLLMVFAKEGNLIKSQYEMLKFNIWCIRFESNYNSCTNRNSENICCNHEGDQEKGKIGWNSIKVNWAITDRLPMIKHFDKSFSILFHFEWFKML